MSIIKYLFQRLSLLHIYHSIINIYIMSDKKPYNNDNDPQMLRKKHSRKRKTNQKLDKDFDMKKFKDRILKEVETTNIAKYNNLFLTQLEKKRNGSNRQMEMNTKENIENTYR
jgi:hypothetical protein